MDAADCKKSRPLSWVKSASTFSSNTLPSGLPEHPKVESNSTLIRSGNQNVQQKDQIHWTPTSHQLLIMMTLSLVSLMVALDACVIVTSLNAIIVDLKVRTTDGVWIGTSYLLANAVTMPFLAELSHIFGRPIVLVTCLCSFAIGTLLCCLAQSIALLLVGRTIQGVGGAGIMALSLVIFTDIVPLRWRPKWYGFVLGAWAVGNCVGPVIGGAIAQHTTWRWVFYLMFPICITGIILVLWLFKLRTPCASTFETARKVDWTGGALFIISATVFLLAISWGGSQFHWRDPGTLTPLCLGFFGILGTIVYETRHAEAPFLRKSLFGNTSSIVTYLCGAIQGLIIYGQLYYIPFYFISVKGYTPIMTGLATLPVMVTCIPSSMATGFLVSKTGDYRWPIWVGWAFLIIGSGLTILFGQEIPASAWIIILIVVGFGHGAILNAQSFASQAMCKAEEEEFAAAMYVFTRQFGMAFGVGVGASVFQNTMAMKLKWEGLDSTIASNSEAFVVQLWERITEDLLRDRVLSAYVFGFRALFLFFTCMSAVAFFLSLFIKPFHMSQEVNSKYILRIRSPGVGTNRPRTAPASSCRYES